MTANLSRPVDIRRLHKEQNVTVEATETERTAIAKALELLSLESLTAQLSVTPWRQDGVRVSGTVHAKLSQACIVTLEPVENIMDEPFEVCLHPEASAGSVVEIDPDAPDPPDILEGDTVDVGAMVLEHFALALDPYPRAPGVEFEPPKDESEDEPSPFAALAALKKTLN
ncbi:MAG: DUF177 domain-containing protein [Pseudomonadota bacterium]